MKNIQRQVLIVLNILCLHAFSYGSAALTQSSRAAVRTMAPSLTAFAPSLAPATAADFTTTPTNSPYSQVIVPSRTMQYPQFNTSPAAFKPMQNTQQRSFSTQAAGKDTIATDAQREAFFKNLGVHQSNQLKYLIEATKGFSAQKLEKIGFDVQKSWQSKLKSLGIDRIDEQNYLLICSEVRKNETLSAFERLSALQSLLPTESKDINIPLLVNLTESFSYQMLSQAIVIAQNLAGNNPLNMVYIRPALLNAQFGKNKPMGDPSEIDYSIDEFNESKRKLEKITIHYEKGKLRSTALHEASHAIALMNSQLPSFVATMSLQPRGFVNAFVQPRKSYPNLNVSYTDQQKIKEIIIALAGTVGEQLFDTYRYQGYSSSMVTGTDEIYNFLLSRIGAANDMSQATIFAREIARNQGASSSFFKKILGQEDLEEKVKEIIADCYVQTYELVSKNKLVIEKLADAAMQKGTLHEDEIYEIADIARPLHSFEHGAMTESESATLGQYRFPVQHQFGYNEHGQYVGSEGYRDKQGNFLEVD